MKTQSIFAIAAAAALLAGCDGSSSSAAIERPGDGSVITCPQGSPDACMMLIKHAPDLVPVLGLVESGAIRGRYVSLPRFGGVLDMRAIDRHAADMAEVAKLRAEGRRASDPDDPRLAFLDAIGRGQSAQPANEWPLRAHYPDIIREAITAAGQAPITVQSAASTGLSLTDCVSRSSCKIHIGLIPPAMAELPAPDQAAARVAEIDAILLASPALGSALDWSARDAPFVKHF